MLDVEVSLEEKVAVFVVQVHEATAAAVLVARALARPGIAAEEQRALATRGQDRIGEHAEIVLGVGIGQPIPETAEVIGPHMRHAVRGACELDIDTGDGGRWRWRWNDRIVMIPAAGAQRQHERRCKKKAKGRSRATTVHEERFLRRAPREQAMTKKNRTRYFNPEIVLVR